MTLSAASTLAADSAVEYLGDMQHRFLYVQQGWARLGIDTAAYNPQKEPQKLRIRETEYTRGVGFPVPGELVISLNGEYELFESMVGTQSQSDPKCGAAFMVYVDGKEVFGSGLMTESTGPKPVRIPVGGANVLRLVTSAIEGTKSCASADWIDARLTRDPNAKKGKRGDKVDVAPFARVMTWDPGRINGTQAGRVDEFPAEDLYFEKEVIPEKTGAWRAPTAEDGRGCIGLEWLERRRLDRVGIRFDASSARPAPEACELQYWAMDKSRPSSFGSIWQGQWKSLKGVLEAAEDEWSYKIDWRDNPDGMSGALKIRWIFPPTPTPVLIRNFTAVTITLWETADLLVQMDRSTTGSAVTIEIYNGQIIYPEKTGRSMQWDPTRPLRLKVRYCRSEIWQLPDRSVLRFRFPDDALGIAVDDVVENENVYVKDFGLFAARGDSMCGLEEYKKRIAGRRTILEEVRRMPDQTFAQAFHRLSRPDAGLGPTLLSLACDNRKFVVNRNGQTQFQDSPTDYNTINKPSRPYNCRLTPTFGRGEQQTVERHLQDGWYPIEITTTTDNGVLYRQRTFVAPFDKSDLPTGTPSWLNPKPLGVMEQTISNPTTQTAEVRLRLDFVANGEKENVATVVNISHGAAAMHGDILLASINTDGAKSLNLITEDKSVAVSGTLTPGAQARCVVMMPRWESAKVGEVSSIVDVEDLIRRTEAYWDRVMRDGMRIELPDKGLRNIILASQVHCFLAARNDDGERIAPWIASISYGPLESEAHSVIRGMQFMGHLDFARRGLEYFIKQYNPQGYLTTGYTTIGTGWHLWTLAEYYRLTGDKDWMRAIAPEVARVCRWVMAQLAKTKRLTYHGQKAPEYGLMPPGVLADWSVYNYYFYMNGYYYAGLNGAGAALADIGWPDAGEILATAADYRRDIQRAFHWVQSLAPVFPLRNGTWVPEYPTHVYAPSPIVNYYVGEDAGRSWCYDVELGAHHLAPMGVLDPLSRDVDWTMNHMEDVQFLKDGWFCYPAAQSAKDWFNLGGFAKVQPYYARTGEVYAMRDDVKPFIRTYNNSLVSLLNPENLSLWEHFINGAFNKTHETGYFLHQSRLMLVQERGTELWLAPFVTSDWLKEGMTVAVQNAVTLFGRAGYRITSHVAEGFIEATIDPPTEGRMPSIIVIRLRHPEGARMRLVWVNGKSHSDFDAANECVHLQADAGTIQLRVEYQ